MFSRKCWVQTLCILVLSVCFQMQMGMNILGLFCWFFWTQNVKDSGDWAVGGSAELLIAVYYVNTIWV